MPPKPKETSSGEVTYPRKGAYVVTVGGQPVFSHDSDKQVCLIKQQQLIQELLSHNEDLTLSEFDVKVGQTSFADRDDKKGSIEY